jgi:hypothetical protein
MLQLEASLALWYDRGILRLLLGLSMGLRSYRFNWGCDRDWIVMRRHDVKSWKVS